MNRVSDSSVRFARSEALYRRAVKTIPLASQTFSKSVLNFVHGASPLFLERGSGCHVWDVDGNRYVDYLLGLLPIVLGYRDPDVDAAVRAQLDRGISFSLATELEVQLAECLVRLIPCAEQVRFGKNGSDATSAAVRLARAHTGRERVALCGYHGWHDWYIGTTSRHLGVPQVVRDLSTGFPYNDADALESMLKADPQGFAAVILEPVSVTEPAPGFLERLRALTERYGVVLIFDEIVTGFRIDLGGAQRRYGVVPDLAAFGKAMGNGMPISAVVGRAEFMKGMEDIFFSTTFGGETLSLAAALATVDKLERTDAVARFTAMGRRLRMETTRLIEAHGLADYCACKGPDWWPRLQVLGRSRVSDPVAVSLLRQELLGAGLLMTAGFNLCLAHDEDAVLADTGAALAQSFAAFADTMGCADPKARLRGDPIQAVFQVRADRP